MANQFPKSRKAMSNLAPKWYSRPIFHEPTTVFTRSCSEIPFLNRPTAPICLRETHFPALFRAHPLIGNPIHGPCHMSLGTRNTYPFHINLTSTQTSRTRSIPQSSKLPETNNLQLHTLVRVTTQTFIKFSAILCVLGVDSAPVEGQRYGPG